MRTILNLQWRSLSELIEQPFSNTEDLLKQVKGLKLVTSACRGKPLKLVDGHVIHLLDESIWLVSVGSSVRDSDRFRQSFQNVMKGRLILLVDDC